MFIGFININSKLIHKPVKHIRRSVNIWLEGERCVAFIGGGEMKIFSTVFWDFKEKYGWETLFSTLDGAGCYWEKQWGFDIIKTVFRNLHIFSEKLFCISFSEHFEDIIRWIYQSVFTLNSFNNVITTHSNIWFTFRKKGKNIGRTNGCFFLHLTRYFWNYLQVPWKFSTIMLSFFKISLRSI